LKRIDTLAKFSKALEKWNERFSVENYLFGKHPNHYLVAQKEILKPGKALMIADGEGRNSVWLAQQGLTVDAFDFSPIAIEKAKKLAAENSTHVNFICSDWQSFAWQQNAYDYIIGIFFQFADPEERQELFRLMDQSLKVGGLMILQGYGQKQLQYNTGGPGVLENLYTEELLKNAFQDYQILDCTTYEKEIDEGDGHAGMSALVGYVGKKR
jgi:cyclopropane fatty-acyl-phospholipid synthase-like methyltransferase